MSNPRKPLTPEETNAFSAIQDVLDALPLSRLSDDGTAVHIYETDGAYKGSLRLVDLAQPDLTLP